MIHLISQRQAGQFRIELRIVAGAVSQAQRILGLLVVRANKEQAVGAHQHFFPGFFGFSRSRSFMTQFAGLVAAVVSASDWVAAAMDCVEATMAATSAGSACAAFAAASWVVRSTFAASAASSFCFRAVSFAFAAVTAAVRLVTAVVRSVTCWLMVVICS